MSSRSRKRYPEKPILSETMVETVGKKAKKALVLAHIRLGSGASKDQIENHALELMNKTDEELNRLLGESKISPKQDSNILHRCPNPACGSDGFQLEVLWSKGGFNYVECQSCGTRGPKVKDSEKGAIEGWNNIPRINQVQQLKDWVSDLQSGMYVNCVYCGHRYGPKEDTPVAMADVLKEHIAVCPDHPLSHANQEIEELKTTIKEMQSSIARLKRK